MLPSEFSKQFLDEVREGFAKTHGKMPTDDELMACAKSVDQLACLLTEQAKLEAHKEIHG